MDTDEYIVTDVQNLNIMTDVWNSEFCISVFYAPKALFCSNINDVLQNDNHL